MPHISRDGCPALELRMRPAAAHGGRTAAGACLLCRCVLHAGAVGVREVVTAAELDASATVVVLGDSTGHVRVLDTSAGIDTSSEDAAAASFKQVSSTHAPSWAPALLPGLST